ncbi:MAG: hypothetical protein JO347_03950 [Candidatus Eremiobacteraeota bacterium]|nr:hypothetical protein [Candidatus Eremiobacteraeota bacterium]
MPLQNRVTPFGDLVAVPEHGLMMGNRGVLHDDAQRIKRPWQLRRWIACVLEFRGRKRKVMQPHRYTELFFLDEATSFAAGHRPCAECRRADYNRFRELWRRCVRGPAGADDIDLRLDRERLDGKRGRARTKRVYRADLSKLPDGTFVVADGRAWLVWGDALLAWSPGGYTEWRERGTHRDVDVLTPRSTVAIFSAGYRPAVHPSATARSSRSATR